MDRLSDISNIKKILAKHDFNFSKKYGQNFLINPSVCPKMAEYSINDDCKNVIEIGPGIGVLTRELAKRAKKVVAIEIDKRLIPVLSETLSDFDNIKVINEDVMKLDLNKLIDEEFCGENVCVCANLPYYITSPVIMKLLEDKLKIKSITVMVQKEAGRRLCASLGTRECGAVTYCVQYYSKPQILFDVSKGSFMPSPNVDSCVIKLDIRDNPEIQPEDEKMYFNVIKAAFLQRRKTIANSISSGLSIAKDSMNDILLNAGISANKRAEQLSEYEFCEIADIITETNIK